jgi:hypothetical protein
MPVITSLRPVCLFQAILVREMLGPPFFFINECDEKNQIIYGAARSG